MIPVQDVKVKELHPHTVQDATTYYITHYTGTNVSGMHCRNWLMHVNQVDIFYYGLFFQNVLVHKQH